MSRVTPWLAGRLFVTGFSLVAVAAFAPAVAQQRDRDREAPVSDEPAVPGVSPRVILPPPDARSRWYFGARVRNTDTGVLITYVEPASPAQRAGLEVQDRVVTVNGYQVGRVLGRVYELARELELRADAYGKVFLLVQNHRDGRLMNLDVQLVRGGRPQPMPQPQPAVRGSLGFRQPVTLPAGTEVTLRIIEQVLPAVRGRVIVEQTLRDPGQPPIPFSIEYDPGQINPQRIYTLQVVVSINGRPAFHTTGEYRVITNGRTESVEVQATPSR